MAKNEKSAAGASAVLNVAVIGLGAGPMTTTGIHMLDVPAGVSGDVKRVFASVKQLGSKWRYRSGARMMETTT